MSNKKKYIILGVVCTLLVAALVTLILFLSKYVIDKFQEDSEQKKYALEFKEEYESLNGKEVSEGVYHRSLNIDKTNPYRTVNASDIVEMMNNGETFYVYFGFTSCPWCRSVIETSIKVSKKKNINKIYYVNIYDIRDTLGIDSKGNLKTTKLGSDEYYELLDLMGNVLNDYTLTDSEGKEINTNEKRIYAPNFVYVENGKAVRMISGVSSLQTDSREKLSDMIIDDMENMFTKFFE